MYDSLTKHTAQLARLAMMIRIGLDSVEAAIPSINDQLTELATMGGYRFSGRGPSDLLQTCWPVRRLRRLETTLPLPTTPAGCLIQPIKMPLLTGGVPTVAEVASGHATGVFFWRFTMNPNDSAHDDSCHRNGHARRKRTTVTNTPQNPASADAAEQFRRLLAELIARQIMNERQKPPAPRGDDQP